MKKINILFICQGNIGRSPTAMFLLQHRFRQLGIEDDYEVTSAALESTTEGCDMDDCAKAVLDKHHIPYTKHHAHQLTDDEFLKQDYVLYMEDYQLFEIRIQMPEDFKAKLIKLSEYHNEEEIKDPNYTGDFEKAYEEIDNGIDGFLKEELHLQR